MAVVASFPVIDLQRTGRSIEARRKEAGLSVRQLQDYFGFEYPQAIYKWLDRSDHEGQVLRRRYEDGSGSGPLL